MPVGRASPAKFNGLNIISLNKTPWSYGGQGVLFCPAGFYFHGPVHRYEPVSYTHLCTEKRPHASCVWAQLVEMVVPRKNVRNGDRVSHWNNLWGRFLAQSGTIRGNELLKMREFLVLKNECYLLPIELGRCV